MMKNKVIAFNDGAKGAVTQEQYLTGVGIKIVHKAVDNKVVISAAESQGIEIQKKVVISGEEVLCNVVDFQKSFPESYFSDAQVYRKNAVVAARQAKHQEVVTTSQDGTKNIAEKGDWIIQNPGEDAYVFGNKSDPITVRQANFVKKYELIPGQTDQFQSKGTIRAKQIDRNIVFATSWGEEMAVKSGGWVADGGYSIAAASFENTYKLEQVPVKGPFSEAGFNLEGTHKSGTRFDEKGFDWQGFNKEGFNRKKLHRNGTEYDDAGFDVRGYDKHGCKADGFNDNGFNKDHIHRNGTRFDLKGYDHEGYGAQGYSTAGLDRSGRDSRGYYPSQLMLRSDHEAELSSGSYRRVSEREQEEDYQQMLRDMTH